ncbi:MAG: PIN domain-containing protein [Chloroflexi bacterium]|nr:MAG: PIN domain-containing protein [Chloroflexota bacterium]
MTPVRIYLDTSVYNRPFDDQQQPRIWLETMALSVIPQMIESGDCVLVTSSVVAYETSKNPHAERRAWVGRVTALAGEFVNVNPAIRQRAIVLERFGINALDALHMASAESVTVDFLLTCDDRLIRRYRQIGNTKTKVADPVTFVRDHDEQEMEAVQ